jgi:hypothetical protein
MLLGDLEGSSEGASEGESLGNKDGFSLGWSEGMLLGDLEGSSEGASEGESEGSLVGLKVGKGEGIGEGGLVGTSVGPTEGLFEGIFVGALDTVGAEVTGDLVGGAAWVGAAEGATVTFLSPLKHQPHVTGHPSLTVPCSLPYDLSQNFLILFSFVASQAQSPP